MPAHLCQRIGAVEARWAYNPKALRSNLIFAILSLWSCLAQLVERKILNLVVEGSSLMVGVLFAFFVFTPVGPVRGVCNDRDPILIQPA